MFFDFGYIFFFIFFVFIRGKLLIVFLDRCGFKFKVEVIDLDLKDFKGKEMFLRRIV